MTGVYSYDSTKRTTEHTTFDNDNTKSANSMPFNVIPVYGVAPT